MDLLRDPGWQAAGALISLLALPFTYWLYLCGLRHKRLGFGVVSVSRLMSADDGLQRRLTVLVDDEPATNVHIVVLCIRNIGTEPIDTKDFEREMRIAFHDAIILSAEVVSRQPGNLEPRLCARPREIVAYPLLLNAHDELIVQVLTSGEPAAVDIDARIAGISQIDQIINDSPGRFPYLFTIGLWFGTAVATYLTARGLLEFDFSVAGWKEIGGAVIISLGDVAMLALSCHLISRMSSHLQNRSRYFRESRGLIG